MMKKKLQEDGWVLGVTMRMLILQLINMEWYEYNSFLFGLVDSI